MLQDSVISSVLSVTAGSIALTGIASRDGEQDIQTLDDLTEDAVFAIQPGSRHVGDEELAAVGAGSGIRHRQNTRLVMLEAGIELILEAVARSAGYRCRSDRRPAP